MVITDKIRGCVWISVGGIVDRVRKICVAHKKEEIH